LNNYFHNKVVLITGGAGGIGSALCSKLLVEGAKVIILDLDVTDIRNNDQLLAIQLDICDKAQLKAAVTEAITRFKTIDVLINNAGVAHMSRFEDLSEADFDKVIEINFTAAVSLTRLCLPMLKQCNGHIVAVSSVAGFAPLYGRSAYSASKHALQGFFLSLASELEQVSVTIVCPSFVRSRPELQVQVNKGLSSPGAEKKDTGGEQIAPDSAAIQILSAVENKQRVLYLGKISKISRWLYALFPKLFLKLMLKKARAEFS